MQYTITMTDYCNTSPISIWIPNRYIVPLLKYSNVPNRKIPNYAWKIFFKAENSSHTVENSISSQLMKCSNVQVKYYDRYLRVSEPRSVMHVILLYHHIDLSFIYLFYF